MSRVPPTRAGSVKTRTPEIETRRPERGHDRDDSIAAPRDRYGCWSIGRRRELCTFPDQVIDGNLALGYAWEPGKPAELVIVLHDVTPEYRQYLLAYLATQIARLTGITGVPPKIALWLAGEPPRPLLPIRTMDAEGLAQLVKALLEATLPASTMSASQATARIAAQLGRPPKGQRHQLVVFSGAQTPNAVELRALARQARHSEVRVLSDLERTLITRHENGHIAWTPMLQALRELLAQVTRAGPDGETTLRRWAQAHPDQWLLRAAAGLVLRPGTTPAAILSALRASYQAAEEKRARAQHSEHAQYSAALCRNVDEVLYHDTGTCDADRRSMLIYLDMLRDLSAAGDTEAQHRLVEFAVRDYYPRGKDQSPKAPWNAQARLFARSRDFLPVAPLAPLAQLLRDTALDLKDLVDALITPLQARHFFSTQGQKFAYINRNPQDNVATAVVSTSGDFRTTLRIEPRGLDRLLRLDEAQIPDPDQRAQLVARIIQRIRAVIREDPLAGVIWIGVFQHLPEVQQSILLAQDIEANFARPRPNTLNALLDAFVLIGRGRLLSVPTRARILASMHQHLRGDSPDYDLFFENALWRPYFASLTANMSGSVFEVEVERLLRQLAVDSQRSYTALTLLHHALASMSAVNRSNWITYYSHRLDKEHQAWLAGDPGTVDPNPPLLQYELWVANIQNDLEGKLLPSALAGLQQLFALLRARYPLDPEGPETLVELTLQMLEMKRLEELLRERPPEWPSLVAPSPDPPNAPGGAPLPPFLTDLAIELGNHGDPDALVWNLVATGCFRADELIEIIRLTQAYLPKGNTRPHELAGLAAERRVLGYLAKQHPREFQAFVVAKLDPWADRKLGIPRPDRALGLRLLDVWTKECCLTPADRLAGHADAEADRETQLADLVARLAALMPIIANISFPLPDEIYTALYTFNYVVQQLPELTPRLRALLTPTYERIKASGHLPNVPPLEATWQLLQ